MPATPDLIVLPEQALFDHDWPALRAGHALCIGLTIDWERQHVLHDFARRHCLPDEQARAARFLHPEDGLRHLLGRMLLRRAASHYGGMDPAQPIALNAFGKPCAPGTVNANISHAGNQVWIALARHAQVGIDVESSIAPNDIADISSQFHPEERAALRRLSDPDLAAMRCWNRKEAVAKATGMGLSLALDAYAVSCAPAPADWLLVAPPGSEREHWSTLDLPVLTGFVCAVALDAPITGVSLLCLHTRGADLSG